jgi:putative acetyltransferase
MECKVYTAGDWDKIIDIWLRASLKAHDFIPASFWKNAVDDMKSLYLPHSEVYVVERGAEILGFAAMSEQTLAALFVDPAYQGQGIGSILLEEVKRRYGSILLKVYVKNKSAVQFYKNKDFRVVSQEIDERTGEEEYLMSL